MIEVTLSEPHIVMIGVTLSEPHTIQRDRIAKPMVIMLIDWQVFA